MQLQCTRKENIRPYWLAWLSIFATLASVTFGALQIEEKMINAKVKNWNNWEVTQKLILALHSWERFTAQKQLEIHLTFKDN